ncbi:hypothetical protein EIK77_000975 [Talaromyces pinophilus]|nr:hypothetical protein EIK77_000975 [Talaromyces pinophilus]
MSSERVYDEQAMDDIEDGSVKELDRDDESIQSEEIDDDDSSEDEKQLEDDNPKLKRLQEIVKAIKNKKIDWDNPKEYFGGKNYQGRYSGHVTELSEGGDDNILHLIVKDDDATADEIKELAKAIKYIVRFYPRLMTTQNKQSFTPLYYAVENLDKRKAYLIKNGFFKSRIKEDMMAKAIGTPCGVHQETCLHRVLKAQPINYTVLNLLIASADRQTVNAKDAQAWTPLHRAAQYEHSSEEMLDVIEKLIKMGEPDPDSNGLDSSPLECAFDTYSGPGREKLSVYEYHLKTREDDEQREKARAAKSTTTHSRSNPTPTREEPKQIDQPNKHNSKPAIDGKGGENLQKLNQKERESTNANVQRRKRGKVEGNQESEEEDVPKLGLVRANTNLKRVAFSESNNNSASTDKKDTRAEKRQYRESWSLKILHVLKLHCLRTRTIAQATRFLYGTNKDGNYLAVWAPFIIY